MNVLVVTEKYCDLNSSLGITSGQSNLVGSLSCTNHNFEVLYFDEYLFQNNKPIDEFLITKVKETQPDLVVVNYYPVANDSRNIKLETMGKIRDAGIPVVNIWFDMVHCHIEEIALKCSEYNTLNVVIDVCKEPNEKFMQMTVPQDERLFCWQDNKPNNVCFVGSQRGYGERTRYLNYLKDKVNLTISGGQREHKLTITEYAQILKDSKISINFPSKPCGAIQTKSRIYESMLCGCLLLERDNANTRRWFNEDDLVFFSDEEDLFKKILYYLKNDSERMRIAKNGHTKMVNSFNSQQWWNRVIARAKELS